MKTLFLAILYFSFFSLPLFLLKVAHSSLIWSGSYRIDGNFIQNPELVKEDRKRKSYVSHHLVLKPKIIVADSVRIYSRFDIFSSSYHPWYLNSIFGHHRDSEKIPQIGVFAERGQDRFSEYLQVNHLYLVFLHEFGSLILGRVPLEFGLGLTHNSGKDFFDDWLDHRDVVAYKVVTDRFVLMPMLGKINEGAHLDISDDLHNLLFYMQYETFDKKTTLGLFYEWRRVSKSGNDANKDLNLISSDVSSEINSEQISNALSIEDLFSLNKLNFHVAKEMEQSSLHLEVAFHWGKTGLHFTQDSDSSQEENEYSISLSGFAVAFEYYWKPQILPKWVFSLWGGMAEGDDPSTKDKYEFYAFDRNYDVAFLMFNHPLGRKDLLSTNRFRRGENSRTDTTNTEALSNAFYFSPRSQFHFFKHWSAEAFLTGAWLWENSVSFNKKRTLGYELDLSLLFEPTNYIIWKTQLGFMLPGSAFKTCHECKNSFSYGFSTKVGVKF